MRCTSQTTNTVKKMALYLYTHSYNNLKKKVCTVPHYFPGMQDTVFLWSLSGKPTWILSSHLGEQKQDLINHLQGKNIPLFQNQSWDRIQVLTFCGEVPKVNNNRKINLCIIIIIIIGARLTIEFMFGL